MSDGRAVVAGGDAIVHGSRCGAGSHVNVFAPYCFAFHMRPCCYARYGVFGQRLFVDALAVKEGGGVAAEPEVAVLKALLAAGGWQVGGIFGDDMQEYPQGVAVWRGRRTVSAEIVERAVVGVDVKVRPRERIAVCGHIVVCGAVSLHVLAIDERNVAAVCADAMDRRPLRYVQGVDERMEIISRILSVLYEPLEPLIISLIAKQIEIR